MRRPFQSLGVPHLDGGVGGGRDQRAVRADVDVVDVGSRRRVVRRPVGVGAAESAACRRVPEGRRDTIAAGHDAPAVRKEVDTDEAPRCRDIDPFRTPGHVYVEDRHGGDRLAAGQETPAVR